jgi:rhomboid protease GluP
MGEGLDWIELVVKASKFFGLNPVRVRWKLRAWANRVKSRKDLALMEGRQLTRGLKTCPACGAIEAAGSRQCAHCGARLYSAPIEFFRRLLRRLGITIFAETAIAAACVAIFILTTVGSTWIGLGPMAIISPSNRVLVNLGGNFAPYTVNGEWWRLWTSIFLHGGIVHLGFNLMALYYVAPAARDLFGSSRMLLVYAFSGLAASAASTWWSLGSAHPGVSIGASGAIAGLIGLVFISGWLDRTRQGLELRNQMLRWMAYILVFGYLIHADNAAHLGGFAAGTLLGAILPRHRRSSAPGLDHAVGVAFMIVAAGTVAWIAFLLLNMQLP